MNEISVKEMSSKYEEKIYIEMKKRGFSEEEIPFVINKTGFYEALEKYPEEQMHYSISDAVDEIIFAAAAK